MVDRVDIGIDGADEPVSFFQGQKTVSESVYKSSPVDFYSTSLGMTDLAEDTGISVDNDLTELKQFTPDVSTSNDDDDDGPPDILSGKTLSGEYGFTPTIYDGGAPPVLGGTTFNTYSDYLNSNKKTDRVFSFDSSLAQNIIEPLVDGDFSNIQFGKQVSGSAKRGVEDIKAAPGKAKNMFDRLVDGELTTRDSQKIAGGVMSVLGGLPGAAAAGFIGGETVTNAFGNASFRPSGVLGAVADTVHTLQYKIAASNRAYTNSLSQYGSLTGADTGFSMLTGRNFGVMREHGKSSYTGNYGGLSREHVVALDRLSQGNDPIRSYDITKANTGTSIEGGGGVFVSNNRIDGFYRGNGTFYNPRTNQSAAGGNMSHVDQLAAKTFGVSDVNHRTGTGQVYRNAVRNALEVARAGTMTLNEALALEKEKIQPTKPNLSSIISSTPQDSDIVDVVSTRSSERDDAQSDKQDTASSSSSSRYEGYSPSPEEGRGGGRRFADGGRVGYAPGGAVAQGGSGFIDRPPEQVSEAQSVADNRPDAVPEGTFVINAPAVEFAGSNDIKKMLIDAHKEAIRRGITVDKDGKGAKLIDVALSSGEVKVAPHLAKIIGYDRLNKINNRGKPEVEERIEENGQSAPAGTMQAAMGGVFSQGFGQERATLELTSPQEPQGFIAPPTPESHANEKTSSNPQKFVEQPDVGMDVSETPLQAPPAFVAQLEQHYKKPVTRTQNKKLYNNMNEEQLLAHMIMAETNSSVDPEEAMYAVGQTAIHRRNSNEPEFKKQKSLRDVLLKRLPKGAFEYVGMDVKRNKGLKQNFTTNRANYEKGLARATAVAQDLLGGEMESDPTVSPDVMWYTRKDAPNQWMRNNLILVKTIGEHEFYKAPD